MPSYDYDSDEPQAGPSSQPASPRHSPKANPLRITLRQPIHSPSVIDKSSLSPPPPLTLKLPRQSLAEKASYSSSDDDDEETRKPVAKKAKTTKSSHSHAGLSKKAGTATSTTIPPPSSSSASASAAAPTLPAQHRKQYDWLEPSTASARHSGPPSRKREDDAIEDLLEESLAGTGDAKADKDKDKDKPRKSHKKRTEPGPGKNWRKGLKKGMAIPWKDDESMPNTPPLEASSRAPSLGPEPEPLISYTDAPFIPADPVKLGFPIFAKPIHPPKLALGLFPKVTASFAPNNGGDTGPFPRKEKVRNWEPEEKVLVGIGGGTLRFASWRRGPTSELGLVLQAEREAKDALRQAKKDKDNWDRPLLTTANSFESKDLESKSVDENESEIGDEETAPGLTGAAPGDGKPIKKRKPAAKPRKSKLAQEIVADEVTA